MNKFLFDLEPPDYEADFLQFWVFYPKGFRRDGSGILQGAKGDAAKAWKGLTAKQKRRALEAVKLLKRGEWIPHAGKFLRQKYYDSLLENVAVQVAKKHARKVAMKAIDGKEYEKWIKEQSRASLETFLKQFPQYKWLVKKLRPELGF